jgi:hypothetical protein
VIRCVGELCAMQVGLDPAFEHLALNLERSGGYTYRNGFALANLVFQNAQSLVERRDQEVHHTVADCLFLGGRIGCGRERGGTGDVASCDKGPTKGIEFRGVEELASQAGNGFRIGLGSGQGIGKWNEFPKEGMRCVGKRECRGWGGFKRQCRALFFELDRCGRSLILCPLLPVEGADEQDDLSRFGIPELEFCQALGICAAIWSDNSLVQYVGD